MNILQRIETNEDLRAVDPEEIPQLCREIRSFLIEKVSRTGGHLASNLGAVELTVALHRVYDPYRDRILFDVGHQSYVHKLLTGRRDRFDTLRQLNGISGFPMPEESEADPFLAGHASDAVSVAAGMARARTLLKGDYDVVAVVGDGAMTGGLCYEGLCDIGASREPVVVVLNDNGMSINENVGGVAKMLSRARTRPGYFRFKKAYRRFLKHMPWLYLFLHRVKENLKKTLIPQGIFDDMGFEYIGPIDGHDESAVEAALRWGKALRVPALIHVVTQKGRGYLPAEQYPEQYHGVNAFEPDTGLQDDFCEDFSACFGETMIRLAKSDPKLCAVTAAMERGTGLDCFARRFPKQFVELGIAEGHAVAMCAGMAKQGITPVFAVYSSFLQRSFDMLMEDVGLMKEHVVLAVDRAGLVGRDGVTHQGSFDIAYLSAVPHMTILAPSSFAELSSMLEKAVYQLSGPVAVRYPRGSEGGFKDDTSDKNTVTLRSGKDVTIVCHGITVNQALEAAECLGTEGISARVIKVNRVLPLDADEILDSLRETGRLVSVEDACRAMSVGSRLLELCAGQGIVLKGVCQLDLGDGVVYHGTVEQLCSQLGLDASGVAASVKELVHEKDPA